MLSICSRSTEETIEIQSTREAASILMIEDTPGDVVLLTQILRYALRGQTYRVMDVPRIAEAFTLIDKESFNIVLLDLHLLDSNGLASVAAIHAHVPHIPIIVYSGTHDEKLKEQAIQCGAKNFLVKGRDSTFLLQFMIEQLLTRH